MAGAGHGGQSSLQALKAAADYPADKLTAMWDYKSDIMGLIVGAQGGNDYERHRS